MARLPAAVGLAVLLAGCIQIGVPDETPPPKVYGGGDVPDGEVPADDNATRYWGAGTTPSDGPATGATKAPAPRPTKPGCAGDGPARAVGDGWTYLWDGLERSFRVEAREPFQGRDTFRINETTPGLPGARWVCAGTGALVAELRFTGDVHLERLTVYDPPCHKVRFPLEVGATWTATCPFDAAWEDPATATYAVTVEAVETVELAAGTFEAFRLSTDLMFSDGTGQPNILSWHVPGLCPDEVLTDTPHWDYEFELASASCA